MDGGLNAVVLLDVKLGEGVVLVGRGVSDITEGGGIDDVSNEESLDGLVLGDGLGGGGASHAVDVAAAVLCFIKTMEWYEG